jgi:O-succinylbenzoic acid--CoA ligase
VTTALHLATGTGEVLAALRRSLAGDGPTAPLPAPGPERDQTLAMLQPDRPVAEPDAAAIVATSGSTGRPRGVVLTRAALVASAEATQRRLQGPGTWVLALPPHYVAGLMVLVRALVADQPLREVDQRLHGLADLDLGAGPCYISLVPTQLTRALADPRQTASLARFDTVLLGGAAADAGLLERTAQAGITVVTTYGMSETCGGCVYDGRPLDGVDVTIETSGRISIAGPTVFAGYRLDPGATAEALVDSRLLTRDRGRWAGGRLVVEGRLDDVVVSGGLNVDLAAVERRVRAWSGGEAAVVGVPHPDWGVEVVAVLESGENPVHVTGGRQEPGAAPATSTGLSSRPETLTALRTDLATTLPGYALPRRVLVTAALPRTSGGKIDRRRLIADLITDEQSR